MGKVMSSNMSCKVHILFIILNAVIAVAMGAVMCPENEQWINCKLAFRGLQRCDDLGNSEGGITVDGPCLGGCVCNEGFLRNSDDVCIPVRECPSCGYDMNATIGNGVHCGNLCSDYRDTYAVCTGNKGGNSLCSCKKGYVFNDVIRKCVHPVDCPQPCGGDFHAIKKSCANPNRPTCAEPKQRKAISCSSGCECIDNYILDRPGGKCIKFQDCPAGCHGDVNATATSCACGEANCVTRYAQCIYCGVSGFSLGCRCNEGYIQQYGDGPCILKEDCNW